MILALYGPEFALSGLCEQINTKVRGGQVKLPVDARGDFPLVDVPDVLQLGPVLGIDLEEVLGKVLKRIALGLVIKDINGAFK